MKPTPTAIIKPAGCCFRQMNRALLQGGVKKCSNFHLSGDLFFLLRFLLFFSSVCDGGRKERKSNVGNFPVSLSLSHRSHHPLLAYFNDPHPTPYLECRRRGGREERGKREREVQGVKEGRTERERKGERTKSRGSLFARRTHDTSKEEKEEAVIIKRGGRGEEEKHTYGWYSTAREWRMESEKKIGRRGKKSSEWDRERKKALHTKKVGFQEMTSRNIVIWHARQRTPRRSSLVTSHIITIWCKKNRAGVHCGRAVSITETIVGSPPSSSSPSIPSSIHPTSGPRRRRCFFLLPFINIIPPPYRQE